MPQHEDNCAGVDRRDSSRSHKHHTSQTNGMA